MATVSASYLELARKSKAELADVFAVGSPPDVTALIGWEFRGFNQPPAMALLGIRKFIKAFYTDRQGRTFGCNTPVRQNGLDGEWIAKPSPERPRRYAFFAVDAADPNAADSEHRGAALLDYGKGGNPFYDLSSGLRDFLVRVRGDSDDLLIGKAYVTVAGARVSHSYFLIERFRELTDADELGKR
jgi:hypothetical protein